MAAPVYVPTDWVDLVTNVSEANMDHIEQGIKAQSDYLQTVETRMVAEEGQINLPTVAGNGSWLKGSGGAAVWASITEADVQNLVTDLAAKEAIANKGLSNGYASLDSGGKVPIAQLPPLGAGTTYSKVTTKTVTNTTGLTDLLNGEIIIGAAKMTSTGSIKLRAGGTLFQNVSAGVGRQLRLQLALGATVIWDATSGGSVVLQDSGTSGWHFEAVIIGTGTGQRTTGFFILDRMDGNSASVGNGGLNTTPGLLAGFHGIGSAVDMTVAETLTLSVALGTASANYTMTLNEALVEVA